MVKNHSDGVDRAGIPLGNFMNLSLRRMTVDDGANDGFPWENPSPPYMVCMEADVSVSESSPYPPFGRGEKKGFLGYVLWMYPLSAKGVVIRGQASRPRAHFDPLLLVPLAIVVIDPVEEEVPLQIHMDQEQQAQGIAGDVSDFDPTSTVLEGVVREILAMVAQPVPSNLLLSYFSINESDDSMVADHLRTGAIL
ncbi:hypothetical protein AMTR_s00017p00232140 [Amborella trichopoda]|uniref:Uncharacterized protein n=1 Tax=Amborella trichopoda TaxID=13333 RepID=W1PFF5_AMBTC|nr:hypothetical protein AMTR_s00017p00232140 [Amborella trichopoda]